LPDLLEGKKIVNAIAIPEQEREERIAA